jgi:hypothetical protein
MNQEKVETDQITDQITRACLQSSSDAAFRKSRIEEWRGSMVSLQTRPSESGEAVLEPRSESGAGAQPSSSGRRRFFRQVGAASLGITAGMTGMQRLVSAASEHALEDVDGLAGEHEPEDSTGLVNLRRRRRQAFKIRVEAARFHKRQPLRRQPTNGDEELYANKIASYSKGLPHNDLGEVRLDAYEAMIHALSTGKPSDFLKIPVDGNLKLLNPQGAYSFGFEGADSHDFRVRPAPTFSSAERAGEMAELYWQALTRDVPFSEYDTDVLTNAAAADLSSFSDYRSPKEGSLVTPATLFRGNTPGDLVGPYISQFLWKDVPYGVLPLIQQIRTTQPGIDHMISYADWLAVQRGIVTETPKFDPTLRYLHTGRDLATYVSADYYQPFLNAALILLFAMKTPLDEGIPYPTSSEIGFTNFGFLHILDLVGRLPRLAIQVASYQKWLAHFNLRPETFAGRIHNHLSGAAQYPINSEILSSTALSTVFSAHGNYLLPQAYPEGCPPSPAYPAGHGTVAGVCATALKAFFKESFVIPQPVQASMDGLSLLPYTGPDLTVGGELNKLAANIALGRGTAGVHYRSDSIEGLELGEAITISVLSDFRRTYNEDFKGFSLTKFDGTTITI